MSMLVPLYLEKMILVYGMLNTGHVHEVLI